MERRVRSIVTRAASVTFPSRLTARGHHLVARSDEDELPGSSVGPLIITSRLLPFATPLAHRPEMGPPLLRQPEAVQNPARRDRDELLAVHRIAYRRSRHRRSGRVVPQAQT